jgi:hypothetical protein
MVARGADTGWHSGPSVSRREPWMTVPRSDGGRLLAACVVATVLLLGLSACAVTPGRQAAAPTSGPASSNEATRAQVPRPLRLTESTWRRDPYSEGVSEGFELTYVVVNPNVGLGALEGSLRLTARDASGSVVYTDDWPVWPIRPGETRTDTVDGGTADSSGRKPAKVDAQLVNVGAWVPAAQWTPVDFQPLRVTDLKLRRIKGQPGVEAEGSGPLFKLHHSYFTGYVENPNSVPFKHFVVEILQRDSAGKLVAGHFWDAGMDIANNVRTLAPGGRQAFRLDVPERLPLGDTYQAYARPVYYADDPLPATPPKNP